MSQSFLTLGSFVFADTELPQSISCATEQKLVVHDLVGGGRVIDAMGWQPQALSWSGLLRGAGALQRLRELQALMAGAQPQALNWDGMSYRVLVRSIKADYERRYQIPYQINCEVLADLNLQAFLAGTPVSDMVKPEDAQRLTDAAAAVNDGVLTTAVTAIQGAITTLNQAATKTQQLINAVLGPVADLRQQVGVLLASTNNLVSTVTTLGGLAPYNPVATQAAHLLGQANAMNSLPALVQLDTALGHVQTTLQTPAATNTVTVMPGASLHEVALQQTGDATQWQGIASANGLNDPIVPGATPVATQAAQPPQAVTLLIPATGGAT